MGGGVVGQHGFFFDISRGDLKTFSIPIHFGKDE